MRRLIVDSLFRLQISTHFFRFEIFFRFFCFSAHFILQVIVCVCVCVIRWKIGDFVCYVCDCECIFQLVWLVIVEYRCILFVCVCKYGDHIHFAYLFLLHVCDAQMWVYVYVYVYVCVCDTNNNRKKVNKNQASEWNTNQKQIKALHKTARGSH